MPHAERPRIPELDGIRGLAILLVLVWHYFATLVTPEPGSWLRAAKLAAGLGWSGVDLFFVLSGFLLGSILLEHRDSPTYFKTFYARRACRILPVYYLLVIAFAVASGLLQGTRNAGFVHLFDRPMPLWSYFTFTQNFAMVSVSDFGAPALSATWSLAVEEQFYLFLPLLIRFVPRGSLPGVLILLIVAAPICRGLLWSDAAPGFAGFVLMPARADALLLGVLAALAIRDPGFAAAFARNRVALGCVSVGLFGGMVVLAVYGWRLPHIASHLAGHLWIAAFYGLLIVWISAKPSGALGALMRFPALRALGVVSYAVYLFHVPVLETVFALARGQPPALRAASDAMLILASLGVTIGLAALSWRLVEKPLLRLGHRFKY
ncbi:MAG TPA: acyltransferase [Verrucomicrobiae bacterium]|nr:acyltransferase [Verrucomicrobiae bacterium]